ncbi:Transmembrane protein 115 [Smittium mucronatum]|uniref:Transmembrane protein 115 n=1 Tax=Smittium mucronatum TaxID=133383 RepID=A0A1R0GL91_9FUNG|nr:Transmembrane protein 115 [Smittium mucronatum]
MELIKIRINGLASVIAGFTVASKQISPDHHIRLFGGTIIFRINTLPVVFMTIVPPILVLFGRNSSAVLLDFGILVSWIYLRFYKRNGDTRGDRSEAFSFTSFFPEFLQYSVKFKIIPSNSDYNTLEDLELGRSAEDYTIDDDEIEALAESERRKNLAIRDINEHLSSSAEDDITDAPQSTPNETN